ncbi:gluconeogenesis factor YvcK family protein [Acidithrix sp. C25]|uniref:gluconeogenesis factor YvcK family protein n=1 Tax=Acidithrix sp. C25 TaxID=1671482 RepID=UPI00191B910E|nr:gluconeogenesis factor YvcK family protein [Acidithrix sp. C25]
MILEDVAPQFLHSSSRIVAIGGGHGLGVTLDALARGGHFPIGIVSVADDGGSSGRLREAFGQIPPGDLRRCISALVPSDSLWRELLEFRFGESELRGHALGNLIFTALATLNQDPMIAALELARLTHAAGRIFPASLDPITLVGEFQGKQILGQARLSNTAGIQELHHLPNNPRVAPVVVEAIERATTIVLGPGSIYTSVIAVCQIHEIREALSRSKARLVYVANLASQVGEAQNMTVVDHIRAIGRYGVTPDVVLYDDRSIELGDIQMMDPTNLVRASLGCRDDTRIHDVSRLQKHLEAVIV